MLYSVEAVVGAVDTALGKLARLFNSTPLAYLMVCIEPKSSQLSYVKKMYIQWISLLRDKVSTDCCNC